MLEHGVVKQSRNFEGLNSVISTVDNNITRGDCEQNLHGRTYGFLQNKDSPSLCSE